MGPFVPDIISEPLNLVLALFIGFGFGFALEQAGFSSSRRLAGVFYGYDFTVLRVFFTAAVTAMLGVLALDAFGLLDASAIFVNPLWVRPAIVGGIIMGAGFILGGYCPGTSLCALAIGKIDAMFFVLGGLLGSLIFGETYPLFQDFFVSTSRGPVLVYDSLGLPRWVFVLALVVMAICAFVATTLIEKRVAKDHAPSATFPKSRHLLATGALGLITLIVIALPSYSKALENRAADPAYQAAHPIPEMTSDELAFHLVDRNPRVLVLDLRPQSDYATLPLPGSRNITEKELFRRDREWVKLLSQRNLKKVVVAPSEEAARRATLLLEIQGFENLAMLQGGFPDFDRLFLNPEPFKPKGDRWDEDLKTFREGAHIALAKLIEEQKAASKPVVKTVKKVQGGC